VSRVNGRTPAQLYALTVGGALVFVGIVGFFYSAAFDSPGKVDAVLGLLDVNGWHNVVHIVSGVAGLLALGYAASRGYALALGVAYLGIAVWGAALGNGQSILGFIPVNTEDTVLHAIIGLCGLIAYAATPAAPPPTTRPEAEASAAGAP
jgi:hypothetical protein